MTIPPELSLDETAEQAHGVHMTSTATSKTRRGTGYATTGAVRQTSGDLPVYICNACSAEVVWATSKRTGRKYLVNVSHGFHGQRFYVGADVHTCQPEPTDDEKADQVWRDMTGAERNAWMRSHLMAEKFYID
jgi:hypothetical protein